MTTKFRIKKKKSALLVIIVASCFIFGYQVITRSSAQAVYSPLAVGLNFQAGWGTEAGSLGHSDADNRAIIDQAAAAGMKWVRIDIGWSSIEYTGDYYSGANDPHAPYNASTPCVKGSNDPGCWYYGRIDKAVDYARSKGLQVLGVWWTTPPWATDGSTGGDMYTRPAGYPTYPEYAESMEWAAKHWEGRINYWEIWNEADPDQKFWVNRDGSYGGAQQYAELLKAAYPAAKRGNPNAKVLTSGPSSANDAWVSSLYGYGIKNYFDVLAVHPYEGLANNDPLNTNGTKAYQYLHIPTLRQVMVDNGDAAKPMWFTEMGYATHDNSELTGDGKVENWNLGVTEQQQGQYLVKAIDYAKKNWPYVEVFIVYNDKNRASAGGDAETSRHQMNFGILYYDNSPKQSVGILRQYLTAQQAVVGDINTDGRVDIADLSLLVTAWGTAGASTDFNKDGVTNIFDLSTLISHWS